MIIRDVQPGDVSQILEIYDPYVRNSAVSFELEVPSVQQMSERINHYTQKFPWLVAEENGKILGYAYASVYRERQAYQWSCECSVYLAPEAKGKGIGQKLYERLFDLLTKQGLRNVYAVIALPNPASEKIHSRLGFEFMCVFKKVGYKLGKWHDVLWMVKTLNDEVEVKEPKWYNA